MFNKSGVEIWSRGMFVALGEGWLGFGPKRPAGLTPKVANIVPGSPIALEAMPPTDGLLAGIVYLSPTLEFHWEVLLLHMLWETWKVKAWISRGVGYYTVFPSQGPAIFWLSWKKNAEATLWDQTGLTKRAWNRLEGGRTQLLKEWHSPKALYKPKIKWVQDDRQVKFN